MDSLDRATQPRDLSSYTEKSDATVKHSNPSLPGDPQRRVPVSPGISTITNTRIASSQNQAEYAVKRLLTKPRSLAPSGTFSSGSASTGTVNTASPFPRYIAPASPTVPLVASLTAINQTTSTAIDSAAGIYIVQPATSFYVFGLVQPVSAPYTLTAGFIILCGGTQVGACFTDGTKFSTVGFGSLGNAVLVQRWDSPTAFNSTQYNQNPFYGNSPVIWFRINDDGVNRNYSISTDGVNFFGLYSESNTVFLTANKAGIFVNQPGLGIPTIATVVSWLVT